MALELGLSDAGLVVPRTADYLDEIRASYVAATGLDVDWDSDLILGVLTAIMAQLLDQQAEALQAVYDAFDLGNATGVQLANLAGLVGVSREAATKAQATITCTGTPGVAIAVGKLVEGGGLDGQARWAVAEDVLIGAGGTVDVVVQAEVAGRTIALAGEIDTIVTPVVGWDSVTNAEAASPGTDAETDDALRIRRAQSIQLSAGLGIGAIRAKVLALDFIEAAAVIDNPDNEDKVVEGISMLAHSYLVIVLPDTLTTAQQEEVLDLLYETVPVSCIHSATDVTGTVSGPDGFPKPVGFDYAVEVAANIVATLTMAPGFSVGDSGPALQELVEAYIGELQIGDDLRLLQLAGLAAQVPGVIAASFTVNAVAADLIATAVQRIVVGTWSAP